MARWFTFTPVPFRGDETFFNRDSGLFSRAFRDIGVESKAVMPLPWKDGDLRDELIRTEYANLESPDWWRQFDLDGVLLYVWSIAKYRPIVAAIRKAGAKTVLYQDCGSFVFPWNGWRLGVQILQRRAKLAHPDNPLAAWAVFLFLLAKRHASILHYPARRRLLATADAVTFPYPAALGTWCRVPGLVPRCIRESAFVIPCPVASHFRYNGTTKEPVVVAVGRWNDEEQKRGRLLLRTMERVWKRCPVPFHVFGTVPPAFAEWLSSLPPDLATLATFHGRVPNAELIGWYNRAQAFLCTSMHESTHIASAEAVCCGCGVVAPPLTSVSCCRWYASEDSGTIATDDTAASLADAVLAELSAWETHRRSPAAISAIWTDRLLAENSVRVILSRIDSAKTVSCLESSIP